MNKKTTPIEKKNRIRDLTAIINKANYDYYIDCSPTMSDAEYDRLFKELQTLLEEKGIVDE